MRKPRRRRPVQKEQSEFEQKILELARVTRVTKGGKRMRFRACLLIGDRKGRVGLGVAKGADVQIAIEKAFRQAKKNIVNVQMKNETIPHDVYAKFGAAKVVLKPAPKGTGLKSGGAIRMVLTLAGVPNAVSKVLGGNNKINNAKATFSALRALTPVDNSEVKPAKVVDVKDSIKKEEKTPAKKQAPKKEVAEVK
ncbi:30S ribosomal protein S5 [Patescibacteria group bacterium]|nr:30S ribosomal protein S5 [Patescibacteria group bacterium]MBU4453050.1 30S ribosomal protein S5 [Patescibacteria group bacterium]